MTAATAGPFIIVFTCYSLWIIEDITMQSHRVLLLFTLTRNAQPLIGVQESSELDYALNLESQQIVMVSGDQKQAVINTASGSDDWYDDKFDINTDLDADLDDDCKPVSEDAASDTDMEDEDDDEEDEIVNESSPGAKAQRILHMPVGRLICGKSPLEPQDMLAAMTAGLEIIQRQLPNWKNKAREQPHYYNNYEGFHFPGCTEGRMYEFPILTGGRVHKSSKAGDRAPPGAHRIIFKATANGGTFCGLITHEGSHSRGSFVACE